MSPIFVQTVSTFFFTLVLIMVLARLAPRLGLLDTPDGRKQHRGDIPTVGGLAIFLSLIVGVMVWDSNAQVISVRDNNDALWIFLGSASFLVAMGVLDDKHDLGVFVRILTEVFVALVVTEALDLRITKLGDLLGTGQIRLPPPIAYPFTVIAIFGIVNAFNMLDGMDGLLACSVLMTLGLFHLFTETSPSQVTLVISSSLAAFLVSNLELSPHVPKTFLGDSGSKLLGFIVVCLLLAAASEQVGKVKTIQPVTALFIVGLPLFDMVFTTMRRLMNLHSPLKSDRSHIHHLMQDFGFSSRRSLLIILSISLFITSLGLTLHRAGLAEQYQLAIFMACFSLYCILVSNAWTIARRISQTHKD